MGKVFDLSHGGILLDTMTHDLESGSPLVRRFDTTKGFLEADQSVVAACCQTSVQECPRTSAMKESSLRAELLRKRREILQRIARVSGDIGPRIEPLSADADDRALELENLDVLFEIDDASRLELGQINRTLERIDDGSYGRCSRCGKPIEAARQQALLYVETCRACAS